MISFDDIQLRVGQAWDALAAIYWRDEPVLSAFFKKVTLLALVLSFVFVLVSSVFYGSLLAGGVLLGLVLFLESYRDWETNTNDKDRKSTRLNSSHRSLSRMPSSA